MTLGGHTFILDSRKIEMLQARNPEIGAHYIKSVIGEATELKVGTVCLGQVKRVEVDGPLVRIYVELDERIEHGTYQGGL